MRLPNVTTTHIETFQDLELPEYAILSHTWGEEEITLQDLAKPGRHMKKGWTKVTKSIQEAKAHGHSYLWIDTCCIDQTSSAELSEAINSMFRWYRKARTCLAYLVDVRSPKLPTSPEIVEPASDCEREATPLASPTADGVPFSESRWFKRGWTLQELIASQTIYFYDSSWTCIGNKVGLEKEISKTTGIDVGVLQNHDLLHTVSVAHRMSWAAKRQTTRTEDVAYCLLGIFDVNMPLLYGEGQRVFVRSQEEITRHNYDQSLFAWNHRFTDDLYGSGLKSQTPALGYGVLAPHPVAFVDSAEICSHLVKMEPYSMTNRGVEICLRVYEDLFASGAQTHVAILQLGYGHSYERAIAIPLVITSASESSEHGNEYCRVANRDLVTLHYSEAALLQREKVYLFRSGPFLEARASNRTHRCRVEEHGRGIGMELCKALYCQSDAVRSALSHSHWDYQPKSMTWGKDWPGVRAALLFSIPEHIAIAIVLTIKHARREAERIRLHVRVEAIQLDAGKTRGDAIRHVSMQKALYENIVDEEKMELDRGNANYRFGDQIVIVEIKREEVFGDYPSMLVLSFSVPKRKYSEICSVSK